ncbi:tyrosine-protein phosphatase non-receptor type 5-like [Dysidea avara]|uniref:tyrosine-protein phosphatase non-receptor type 5-like n=1 Tax=Dysidea avara TaxID=196820 RepID=UPI003322D0E2
MQCFAPTFTGSVQDATIDYGDVHTVTCRADGEDLEFELGKEGTGPTFGFQSPGTFNLENINGDDGGRYRCIARNPCTTTYGEYFTLSVRPRVEIGLGRREVFDNEEISFQCVGDGYPSPSVQWMYDNTIISTNGELSITILTVNDSGVYTCVGTSTVGTDTDSVNITVLPVPIPPTTILLPDSTTIVMDLSSMIEVTTMISSTAMVSSTSIIAASPTSTSTNSDDSREVLILLLAIILPIVCVMILLLLIICLFCDLSRRRRTVVQKSDNKPLLSKDHLSMASLPPVSPVRENPLAATSALLGISEVVEPEEGSTHSTTSTKSDKEEVNDEDAKLLEQETREEEPKEMETTEKETKTTDDEPEQQPVKPSSPTEMPSSPAENRPTFEFKGARSNSIAERAKLFEQRMNESTSPVAKRGPRIPIALPSSPAKEAEVQTTFTTEPEEKPTEPTTIQETEQPTGPKTQPEPMQESTEPLTLEIPPAPTEPPPPVALESEPFSPGPVPPQSPPPPDDEPPPLPTREESLLQSPTKDQATLDAIQKSATVPPPSGRRRMMSEKKRSATVKVSLKSNPLTQEGLRQLVENAKAAAVATEDNPIENMLAKEFHSIPMNFPRPEELPKGAAMKDRYANVKPNPNSRVLLQKIGDDELSTYINANYLKGLDGRPQAYIASQGPTEASMDDFWRMIWEHNTATIVMLTSLLENGKLKCHRYWPLCYSGNDTVQYGVYVVINSLEEKGEHYTTSYLTIYHIDNPAEQREITHFWYTSWPDFGSPKESTSILSLRNRVQGQQGANTAPIVVHCSAGVGRTGVFCAIDMGVQQYDHEQMVNPLRYLSQMRQERGGMIQKSKQYEFVCQALLDYINSKNEV